MTRAQARSFFGRPWYTHKAALDPYDDIPRVTLMGYALRAARIERRTKLLGANRAGRGIAGYGR